MADDIPDEWAPDDTLRLLTDEDIADRLADAFVDARDVVGDEAAADVLDIVYQRLTDEWYHDQATDER